MQGRCHLCGAGEADAAADEHDRAEGEQPAGLETKEPAAQQHEERDRALEDRVEGDLARGDVGRCGEMWGDMGEMHLPLRIVWKATCPG